MSKSGFSRAGQSHQQDHKGFELLLLSLLFCVDADDVVLPRGSDKFGVRIVVVFLGFVPVPVVVFGSIRLFLSLRDSSSPAIAVVVSVKICHYVTSSSTTTNSPTSTSNDIAATSTAMECAHVLSTERQQEKDHYTDDANTICHEYVTAVH